MFIFGKCSTSTEGVFQPTRADSVLQLAALAPKIGGLQ
jgi:hypothetical protein